MREKKIDAIKLLLEFSLLFTEKRKELVLSKLDQFTNEDLDGLGKILSVEHRDRDELNAQMLEETMSSLQEYFEE
jgi:hypothetical protein